MDLSLAREKGRGIKREEREKEAEEEERERERALPFLRLGGTSVRSVRGARKSPWKSALRFYRRSYVCTGCVYREVSTGGLCSERNGSDELVYRRRDLTLGVIREREITLSRRVGFQRDRERRERLRERKERENERERGKERLRKKSRQRERGRKMKKKKKEKIGENQTT